MKFFGFFSIYMLAIWAVNISIIKYSKLPFDPVGILIVGDSHVQDGIDPKRLGNAVNISQPGEPILLSYFKLKKVLEETKVDTVIIGLAEHSLSSFNDLKFVDDETQEEYFNRLYPLVGLSIPNNVQINFNEYIATYCRNMLLIPKGNHYAKFLGNYSPNNEESIAGADNVARRHFPKSYRPSVTSLSYLDSISQLCMKNHIFAVFLSTPVHRSYLELIPKDLSELLTDYQDTLMNRQHLVLNYSAYTLPDGAFKNASHLNELGVSLLHEKLKVDLNNMTTE